MKRFYDMLKAANPLQRRDLNWLHDQYWHMKWRALLQYKPAYELKMVGHLAARGIDVNK